MNICIVTDGKKGCTVATEENESDEVAISKASSLLGIDAKNLKVVRKTYYRHPVENFDRFFNALQLSINSTVSKTFNTGE